MCMANIADQMHLGYISAQNVIDAMRELAQCGDDEANKAKLAATTAASPKKSSTKEKASKKPVAASGGVYEMHDVISRSHLNARLWLNARLELCHYLFDQLVDAAKAKGELIEIHTVQSHRNQNLKKNIVFV